MPALNYKARNAYLVETGKQTMSIRRRKAETFKPGCMLYHYHDQKKKGGGRLVATTELIDASMIYIQESGKLFIGHDEIRDLADRDDVAQANGYPSWPIMLRFFRRYFGLPYIGTIIQW